MVVVKNLLQIFLVGALLLLFSGCLPKQDDVKSVFQTNSATIIKKDEKRLKKLAIKLKNKLDKRNPSSFNKNIESKIYSLIQNGQNSFYLNYKGKDLDNYKSYLQLAFSKDNIQYRNDYLILGIYYLIYEAYSLDDSHKLLALEYNKESLAKLHKNLQVIKWKIKVDKDINDKYLFLTWQNNWQIELEKKMKKNIDLTIEDINGLKYIKEKKETLLDHSNFSFEVVLTQMIDSVENSLISLGEEPTELTVKALFLFF